MVNLKDFAKEYEPQQVKNIADLEIVRCDVEIKHETRKNKEGTEYILSFITIEGVEYRVPMSIIEQLKTVIKTKPDITTFKVVKSGEGMGTKYQVIPLG